ncbi:MAG: ABC transporter permease subunit, partial [Pseudomonadota bacterium]
MSDLEREAFLLSLRVAGLSVAVSLPLALIVSFALARGRFVGRGVLEALVQIPLVVPPVVVGYVLLVSLGRNGIVGSWLFDTFGISLAFTWQGAAVASAVMGFPLMVRAIRISIEAVDPKLEAAARSLGASGFRTVMAVTLPLILPGIIAGMVLAFARSLGEFGATIT